MNVDVADATAHQGAPLDELERFELGCYRSSRQILQKLKHFAAVHQIAACQFAEHERMCQYQIFFQCGGECPDDDRFDAS